MSEYSVYMQDIDMRWDIADGYMAPIWNNIVASVMSEVESRITVAVKYYRQGPGIVNTMCFDLTNACVAKIKAEMPLIIQPFVESEMLALGRDVTIATRTTILLLLDLGRFKTTDDVQRAILSIRNSLFADFVECLPLECKLQRVFTSTIMIQRWWRWIAGNSA